MEVSEYLVGSPAFKAGGTGDPRTAGSIPVHLRHNFAPQGEIRAPGRPRFALRLARGRLRSNRLRSFELTGDVSARQRRKSGSARPLGAEAIPSQLRTTWAKFGGVLLFAFFVLLPFAPLGAQSRLLESSPADGASLSDLEVVSFEFDTLLRDDGASVSVFMRDGTEVAVTSVSVEGTVLTGRLDGSLVSGNYEVLYSVRGSDGAVNEGSIRVSIDSPSQALSGGLLAVIGVAVVMVGVLAVVFTRDKQRRPSR